MQIPLIAGRWISPGDRTNTELVVVIDSRLAKRYWPSQNPIGQHISSGLTKQAALIIGVASTIRLSSLEEDSSDGMRYYASAQAEDAMTNFLIRTDGDPNSFVPVMQRAVASADSAQAAYDIQSLESLVSASLAGRRLIVDMLAAFAALALLLAIVGIYGLISYITTQRASEVGIRMALGAQRVDILNLVLSSVFTWIVTGLVIGAALSFGTVTVLQQCLHRLRRRSSAIARGRHRRLVHRGSHRRMAACPPGLLHTTDRGPEKRVTALSHLDIPTQSRTVRWARIDSLRPSSDVVVLFEAPVNLVRPTGRRHERLCPRTIRRGQDEVDRIEGAAAVRNHRDVIGGRQRPDAPQLRHAAAPVNIGLPDRRPAMV